MNALLLGALAAILGCGGGQTERAPDGHADLLGPPPISTELQSELEEWFAEQGQPPGDYILSLFAAHDVVLLGEHHRIKHDLLLVQDLLPQLYAAGVRGMATEFARRIDQPLLDSLVSAPEWHEDLGREIIFRQFVPWGYREYVDVLKAAWQVNHERPAGAPLLRVLALNHALDYSQIRSEADWDDPEAWRRVEGGQTEADWATPVLAAVGEGRKVLVHCGIRHAFSRYRQPRVQDGEFAGFGRMRFGNHLREALGERVTTVFMHAPWNGAGGYGAASVHPAGGRLDAFMLARSGGPFPVGFAVDGSPLADLPIEDTVYQHGYEVLTMAAFCDGWIYTKPLSEYEPVSYIEGWINRNNFARARANAMNPRWRTFGLEQLDAGCRSFEEDFLRQVGRLR